MLFLILAKNNYYINDKNEFATSNMIIDGALVMNPTKEQLLAAGYHKYVAPEKTLDDYKSDKTHEIMSYDVAEAKAIAAMTYKIKEQQSVISELKEKLEKLENTLNKLI